MNSRWNWTLDKVSPSRPFAHSSADLTAATDDADLTGFVMGRGPFEGPVIDPVGGVPGGLGRELLGSHGVLAP